jgi:hypothetical protein
MLFWGDVYTHDRWLLAQDDDHSMSGSWTHSAPNGTDPFSDYSQKDPWTPNSVVRANNEHHSTICGCVGHDARHSGGTQLAQPLWWDSTGAATRTRHVFTATPNTSWFNVNV